jgi:peptidylprolyl isomerase
MAISDGQTVRVHYRGTLDDGTEFDSSAGREPLEFTVGEGQVIPGFDAAVREMSLGDKTTVTIPACDAYGDHMEEAVQTIPTEAFGDQTPEEGWAVEFEGPDGQRLAAVIVQTGETECILDFNHPLAGQNLTFELELVEVVGGSGIILP